MPKSKLVQRQEDLENKKGYQLTADESKQYSLICQKIIKARNQRETPRDEFDGMTYEQTYLSNKRAAMSYLIPKKNDDEVRINTGTTEKKIELVWNELLALNLEEEIQAFDKDDNLLQDIGEIFTDIVKRTEQMEKSDEKDIFIYRELLIQPSVFMEELWFEEKGRGLNIKKRCERKLIQGIQMYLGDINLSDIEFNRQPYLIKYARMNYLEGERLFKDINPTRWNYITPGSYNSYGAPSNKLYRSNTLQGDEIEVFIYMSYPDDECQIVIQGIPFLEVGKKYTEVFGNLGGYHITMVGLNPYSGDFAYSKPLTQSAKTLQALNNETIRNLIRKFRQVLEPPLGVPKGKVYSRDIWNPGAMAQGVKASDFEKLIDHTGVTQSEMAMFDLIEKKINEFLGVSQQDPLAQNSGNQTATALVLAQRQAIKMLGLSVLSAIRLKNRLALLRVKNVLANYLYPISKTIDPVENKIKDIYARFTLNNAEVGNQRGTKIIQMMDRNMTPQEETSLYAEEQRAKEAGNPFQYKTVNVNILKDLDLYFYVNVVVKEKESNQLDKSMLTEMLNQAQGITAITGRPISANKIVDKFERVWKEKDLFEKAPPPMMSSQMNQMPGQMPQQIQKGNGGQKLQDMMQGNKMGMMSKASNIV